MANSRIALDLASLDQVEHASQRFQTSASSLPRGDTAGVHRQRH
jgi:hypothetical protein